MLRDNDIDSKKKLCLVFNASGKAVNEKHMLYIFFETCMSFVRKNKKLRIIMADILYDIPEHRPNEDHFNISGLPKDRYEIIYSTGNEDLLNTIVNTYIEGYDIMFNEIFSNVAYRPNIINIHTIVPVCVYHMVFCYLLLQ